MLHEFGADACAPMVKKKWMRSTLCYQITAAQTQAYRYWIEVHSCHIVLNLDDFIIGDSLFTSFMNHLHWSVDVVREKWQVNCACLASLIRQFSIK